MKQEPWTKEYFEGPDAIIVDKLFKKFKIVHEKKITVFEHLASLFNARSKYEEFMALNDVSFSVTQGETYGIIGSNGSGKSTLLKVLAGVLYPDSGEVIVNGRIASFLELGVGFQVELTAKENVYLYGALMGIPRQKIASDYEEIMEYSELKRFEDMKLRHFSSGMYVRLAFATAIKAEPDIMLVDEVLAVGDEAFQRKCYHKMSEFRTRGKTILLVTHDLDVVKKYCDKCLLMSNGQIKASGVPDDVVKEYLKEINGTQRNSNT